MSCFVLASHRTDIAPKNGIHKNKSLADLTDPLFHALISQFGMPDQVILGNALGAGGNPARFCALSANIDCPSMTLDTQCCSGLDAIIQGTALIKSGMANLVFVGGVESYSQRPKRLAKQSNGDYLEYLRPPFSPVDDVDMTQAAQSLAIMHNITSEAQHAFAKRSHAKAIAANQLDSAARELNDKLLTRLPKLVANDCALTSASIALEADGAAILALASEQYLAQHPLVKAKAVVAASQQHTASASQPALVPIECCRRLMDKSALSVEQIQHWQVMEAYAVQAMITQSSLGIHDSQLNQTGGALARGHAIAASGTVLACEALKVISKGDNAVCTIAAAGGLGSAVLLQGL